MTLLSPEPGQPTEDSGTLRIVHSGAVSTDHLAVAVRHIEAAITHINNSAQSRVPTSSSESPREVEQLQLIVRALADIRDALREQV